MIEAGSGTRAQFFLPQVSGPGLGLGFIFDLIKLVLLAVRLSVV